MNKERQNKAGGDLMWGRGRVRKTGPQERPTGVWRLVRGKILRAPNWADQGQAV